MYSRNTGKFRTKGQRTGENAQPEEPRGASQAESGGGVAFHPGSSSRRQSSELLEHPSGWQEERRWRLRIWGLWSKAVGKQTSHLSWEPDSTGLLNQGEHGALPDASTQILLTTPVVRRTLIGEVDLTDSLAWWKANVYTSVNTDHLQ